MPTGIPKSELLKVRYHEAIQNLDLVYPNKVMLTQQEIADYLGVGIAFVRKNIGTGTSRSLSKYDVADFLCKNLK